MAKNRPGWICQSQLDTSVLELPYVERYLALPLSVGDSMSGRASLPEQDSPSPRSLSPLGDRHRPREIQTPAPHATACCSRNEFFSKTCYESRTERKTKLAATSRQAGVKTERMRKVWTAAWLAFCLALVDCAARKPATQSTPPPIRSQMPPSLAETIEHCVVIQQENANTVTCGCLAVSTRIDSKTGHTTLVCKKMREE